jgi:hypothetical protein
VQGVNLMFVPLVIHNYRWRLDLTQGQTTYDDLEKRLGRRLLSRRGHSQRLQYAGSRKGVGIITGEKTNNFIN